MRKGVIVCLLFLCVLIISACAHSQPKQPRVVWQPPTVSGKGLPNPTYPIATWSAETPTPTWMAAPPPTLESTRTPAELDAIFKDSIDSWNQGPAYPIGVEIIPAGEVSSLFPAEITKYSQLFKQISDSRSLGDPDIIALTAYMRSNGRADFEFTVKKISVVGLGGIWTGNFGKDVSKKDMKDPQINADMIAQIWLRNMKVRHVTDLRQATSAEIYELAIMYIDGTDNYRGVDYVPSKSIEEAANWYDRRFTQVSPTAHSYAMEFQGLYAQIRGNQPETFNSLVESWTSSPLGKIVINWQPTPEAVPGATAESTPNN